MLARNTHINYHTISERIVHVLSACMPALAHTLACADACGAPADGTDACTRACRCVRARVPLTEHRGACLRSLLACCLLLPLLKVLCWRVGLLWHGTGALPPSGAALAVHWHCQQAARPVPGSPQSGYPRCHYAQQAVSGTHRPWRSRVDGEYASSSTSSSAPDSGAQRSAA